MQHVKHRRPDSNPYECAPDINELESEPRAPARRFRELRQARTLDDNHIEGLIKHIRAESNSPLSDELKFLLSVYAGLRVAEIAGMTLDAVVDADDQIGRHIIVGRHIAKGGRQRVIPMHPRIREALIRFRKAHPDIRFLAFSARHGVRRQNASAVKAWFLLLYRQVGLRGCSSHSGRRTFITRMARLVNLHGGSLRDVQLLAGHARLETTGGYIDPAEDLSRLVAAFSDHGRNSKQSSAAKEPKHERIQSFREHYRNDQGRGECAQPIPSSTTKE